MALSGILLKVNPESEDSVRSFLARVPGVSVEERTPQGELILVAEADSLGDLHKLCEEIEKAEGVLGLYPSYVTTEDEQG